MGTCSVEEATHHEYECAGVIEEENKSDIEGDPETSKVSRPFGEDSR